MTAGDGASARARAGHRRRCRSTATTCWRCTPRRRNWCARCAPVPVRACCTRVTYRVKGHVSVDPAAYRDPEELKAALETDPIARARQHYLALPGAQASQLDAIEREATDEVAAAVAAADADAWPDAASAFTDVQTTGAGQWR